MKGIDTSHHQGDKALVDWNKVKKAGYEFVFMKATQGTDLVDGMFVRDKREARRAGLLCGFYHFAGKGFINFKGKLVFVPQDPIAEADFFIRIVKDIQPGELLVLDWETELADPVEWCKTFLDRVEDMTGIKPLLYTNEARVNAHNWIRVSSNGNELWVAKYGVNDGKMHTMPDSGSWGDYALWQYTSRGKVNGITGFVDLNTSSGLTLDELKKLGKEGDIVMEPNFYDKIKDTLAKYGLVKRAEEKWGKRLDEREYAEALEWIKMNAILEDGFSVLTVPMRFDHFGYQFCQLATYGVRKVYHPGTDYNWGKPYEDLGKPIYAMADGIVSYKGIGTGWGNHLFIMHELNHKQFGRIKVWSHYAHLRDFPVLAVGAKVKSGDIVGRCGGSGGWVPHLHFEIRKRPLGVNYFPYGRSKQWVEDNYYNPETFFN
jgi:lysozyme